MYRICTIEEVFVNSRTLVTLVSAAILAGCAGPPQIGGSPNITVTDMASLPAPSSADQIAGTRPYIVGPYDKLAVDVYGVAELNREVQADASGRIALPLVGQLEAAGRTPQQIAQDISARLSRYIKNPQVTVNLRETVSQVISIDGEVREPGLYPVIGQMTLIRAIATAKGTAEFARLDDVVVFRTVNGRKMAALYNLGAIRNGRYDDPQVYANDVIVVGQSGTRRLFRDVLQVAPALLTPLVYILQ